MYANAIEAYGSDDVSQRLKLLCMTDMARLLGRTLSDYDAAHEKYNEVLDSNLATPLLKAEVHISLGMDLASLGRYADDHFDKAEKLLNSVSIDKNHPLFAHIAERHAWSLVDQWKVDEEKTHFNEALFIREANRRSGQNPFADIYVLHNRHGLAMTSRFRGDTDLARREFDEVIHDIKLKFEDDEKTPKTTSDKQLPGQLRYSRELRERLANSRYRRADCELFSGAASGDDGIDLSRADKLYAQAMEMTNDRTTQVMLCVKLSLVQALLGKTDEAKDNLETLSPAIDSIINPDSQFRAKQFANVIGHIIAVCAAEKALEPAGEATPDLLVAWRREIDQLRQSLQDIATAERLAASHPAQSRYNNNRHEALELRLFYLEFLINAEKKYAVRSNNPTILNANFLREGLSKALEVFKGRTDMMPYARRYHDLAISIVGENDPETLVTMLQDKMGPPSGFSIGTVPSGAAWHLLFQFSSTDNFVILKRDGNQPPEYLSLDLTREGIKNAANRGGKIDPEPELRKILEDVRKARDDGRVVNIYWNDQRCWANAKEALTDNDWPFNTLLQLRILPEQQPE